MSTLEAQDSQKLIIRPVASTSPSLAEQMRLCMLRAGLSQAPGSSAFVLGNPKTWMGIAYHEVLAEVVGFGQEENDLDRRIKELWEAAVAKLHERVQGHPLDRRFGAPPTWPGYYLTAAMARLRALEVADRQGLPRRERVENREVRGPGVYSECRFTAFGGKLVGRPDIVRGDEIFDYKTGEVFEEEDAVLGPTVKASYVRQLRLYACLVKETLGQWPRRGVLLPMVGERVEVDLDPLVCEQEGYEAVGLLDRYNAFLEDGSLPIDLASPSPEACKWCGFKLICPAFWSNAASDWSGRLDGGAIEGSLCNPPRTLEGGEALSLILDAQAGTEDRCQVELAPLDPNIHESLRRVTEADRVRVVGLRYRSDGSLVPSNRTVIARIQDLPIVETALTGGDA